MFKSIFNFELKYRLVRPATYVYFGIFFLLTFLATVTDVVKVSGGSEGIIFRNSPSSIANMLAVFSAFGMLVTSAMMSTPVYRDFEHNSHHLFFTLPITKFGYLGGRFMGSFLITVLVFLGLPLGIMVGSFIGPLMGWVDADKIGPFSLYHYIQPFFTIVVPNILFSGAIFFSLVSLSRKMVYSYMGNVILLVVYIWATSQLGDFDNRNLAALLDPFALTGMGQITRYWTSAESNTLVIPLTGMLLLNRLIWIGASMLLLIFTYKAFRFSSFLEGVKTKSKAEKEKIIIPETIGYKATHQTFAFGNYVKQMFNLAYIGFRTSIK
jgi:ABC-2 type transport system permease protein